MSTSERQTEDRPHGAVLASLRQAIDSITVNSPGSEPGGEAASSPSGPSPLLGVDSAGAATDEAATADPEYRKAKKRALNMLAARDHSSAELRDKLLSKEHPPEVVEQLIDKLLSSKLLDDDAFAESFVRSQRSARSLSKAALRRELRKKGVPEEAAGPAVEAVDDEFDVAFEVALKKARTTTNLPRDTRLRRILGMLARRGFPPGVSMAAAQRALDEA